LQCPAEVARSCPKLPPPWIRHWIGVNALASGHFNWRGLCDKSVCQEWKSQTWCCSQRYDV